MTAPLDADSFEPHVGQPFAVGGVPMVLERVERWGPPAAPAGGEAGRQPFTLTWLGPAEPVLAQRIHDVEHPTLGSLAIFIVPVGSTPAGVHYEAVFT